MLLVSDPYYNPRSHVAIYKVLLTKIVLHFQFSLLGLSPSHYLFKIGNPNYYPEFQRFGTN